ncbi:MAG: hypothetical protein KBF26_12705, partial [Opitutaceae bacterium]|nr:hypothetical protein [Opitutaceae bacterium]
GRFRRLLAGALERIKLIVADAGRFVRKAHVKLTPDFTANTAAIILPVILHAVKNPSWPKSSPNLLDPSLRSG